MSSSYIINTPLSVNNGMNVLGNCTFESPINFTNGINIGSSGSITYNNSSTGGFIFNENLIPSTLELTLGNIVNYWKNSYINNVISDVVNTNKVSFDGVGSMYFQTGSATGCFISGINYNTTGSTHYVYYNTNTKELSQTSPNYFYSYSTGTQQILASSSTTTANFQPVTFNVDSIMYNTFQHTSGSSVFTGTFESAVTLQFTYSLQMNSTSNQKQTAAAVLYLDGSPIAGSYRSATIIDTTGEYALTNTFLVNVPQGSHSIELQVAGTNTNVYVGGYIPPPQSSVPNILPPTNSYTSANLCCTRVI